MCKTRIHWGQQQKASEVMSKNGYLLRPIKLCSYIEHIILILTNKLTLQNITFAKICGQDTENEYVYTDWLITKWPQLAPSTGKKPALVPTVVLYNFKALKLSESKVGTYLKQILKNLYYAR